MPLHSAEPCAYISVSSRCNNDCLFCGLKKYGIDYRVPLAEIREQLGVFHAQGARRVVFTGGEPTLHPDLLEAIRAARDIGFTSVSIFTNARRLGAAVSVAALAEAGLTAAMASLHGHTAATHDATVKSPGAHAQTTRGIAALAASGLRLVINTPITSLNLAEILDMYDRIAALPGQVHRWQLSNIFPTSVVMDNPDLQPDYADVQPVVFTVMERALTGPVRVVTQELPLCVIFPWLGETRDLSDARTQMLCRRDVRGDYRSYRPWSSPYKTKLPTCAPCGMREVCGGIPLCYLSSHRDLSVFRPLEYLSPDTWRAQMGLAEA